MSAIVNAAAQRLESSVGGTATAAGNFSLPQPPHVLPTSPSEILDYVPTEFGDLTGLFGGGSPGEAATQYVPVTTAVTVPGGSVRGALGGLVPDFRNAAQKIQQAIATAPAPVSTVPTAPVPQPSPVRIFPGAWIPGAWDRFRDRWRLAGWGWRPIKTTVTPGQTPPPVPAGQGSGDGGLLPWQSYGGGGVPGIY